MMRIADRRRKNQIISKPLNRDTTRLKRIEGSSSQSFADLLHQEEHSSLKQMIEEIIQIGDTLAEHRTLSSLSKYTNAIRHFMSYTIEHGYGIRRSASGSTEDSYVVETIDKALADLTEVVLARETPRIQILSKLEMIHGLLVDFIR